MTISQTLSLTRDESGNLRKLPILALLAAVMLLPFALSYLAISPPSDSRRDSAVAHVRVTDAGSVASGDDGQVALPDAWNQKRRGFGGTIDYRFQLDARKDGPPQAVFISRVKSYCDILLNGELIYSESGASQSRGSNRVILADLPAGVVIDGDNTLTVRVRGYANDGSGLSEVYIGSVAALRPSYLNRWLVQEELLKLANWIVLAMCVPFVLLWLRDPRNSQYYGLFALGAAIFAARNFHRQFDLQFLPMGLIAPLVAASLGWSALPLWVFFTRYVGRKNALFERSIVVFTVVGTIALFFVPASVFSTVDALAWRTPIFPRAYSAFPCSRSRRSGRRTGRGCCSPARWSPRSRRRCTIFCGCSAPSATPRPNGFR
jgi:hypothetical protein